MSATKKIYKQTPRVSDKVRNDLEELSSLRAAAAEIDAQITAAQDRCKAHFTRLNRDEIVLDGVRYALVQPETLHIGDNFAKNVDDATWRKISAVNISLVRKALELKILSPKARNAIVPVPGASYVRAYAVETAS